MRPLRWILAIVLGGPLAFYLALVLFAAVFTGTGADQATTSSTGSDALSAYAIRTIPALARSLYTDPRVHAECPQLPAAVLAGIGTVETDNGLNIATSPTGAQGFMQFEPATWSIYGVAIGHSGPPDINNPLDSVASAANLLCKNWNKNPSSLAQVIHDNYNHAWWYACDGVPGCPLQLDSASNQPPGPNYRGVMAWAALYQAPDIQTVSNITGAPTPAAVQAIAFAKDQLGKPYAWGATGPDSFDCSGLTSQAYLSAGVAIPRTSENQWANGPRVATLGPTDPNLLPGDLVFFNPGEDGYPGEPGHVAIVVGRQGNSIIIIQAPETGEDVEYTTLGTINPATGLFDGPHETGFEYMGAIQPT